MELPVGGSKGSPLGIDPGGDPIDPILMGLPSLTVQFFLQYSFLSLRLLFIYYNQPYLHLIKQTKCCFDGRKEEGGSAD